MDSTHTCSLHGQRQCCLASPQFLEYIATYSASQPPLVSPGSTLNSLSSSESSTSTVVDSPPAEVTAAQKAVGQLTPRSLSNVSVTPTSILIRARENLGVERPEAPTPASPPVRHNPSPTLVSEPLRSPPTSPPPAPTSTLNSSTSRPMTDSAVAPPARRRTLDFATDENSARRDSKAVNAIPKPTKPIYPRAKITKLPVKPSVLVTPRNAAVSSPRSPANATIDDGSKVTVTPQAKASTSITITTNVKPTRHVKSHSATSMTPPSPKAAPTVKLPNPANHVHLCRKTDTIPISFFAKLFSSKSTYKKKQSEISDIKDVFVIDPELVLPRGLFRALDDSFVGLGRKDSFDDVDVVGEAGGYQLPPHRGIALKRSRSFNGVASDIRTNGNNALTATQPNDTNTKKNLKLEVENGGIDVDVHLVPSLDRSLTTMKRTTIDLRLLPDENFKPGNHPLVARIHAPEKRAPFHLTARTYALPPPPPPANETMSPAPPVPLAPANSIPPSTQRPKSSVLKQHRRAVTSPAINSNHVHHPASLSTISLSSPSYNTPLSSSSSSSISSLLDKSNMEIHIPRSYNGPITIHVASGNLDEHILFSREVKEKSVVLREGRFARGCFIGRQGFDEDENDDDRDEAGAGDDDGKGKGSGECEACRRNKDQSDEKQKAAASPATTAIPNISTGQTPGSNTVSATPQSPGNGLSKPTTPLHIVKRKPATLLSLQNSEKKSISSSLSPIQETPSLPLPPPLPVPPAMISRTITTFTNDSPPPIPSSNVPLDILTNRPSFLDVDPMNGRARRVSDFHLTMAPYKSSPLRYSMTSSLSSSSPPPPTVPLSLEERRRRERERREAEGGRYGGLRGEWVSPLIQGEEGRGGGSSSISPPPSVVAELALPDSVVDKGNGGQCEGEGDGTRPKIMRLDEMSSLPSSSSEEEEEEEENENDGAGSGSGSGSGSDTFESAESAIGNETAEEASTKMAPQNQEQQGQQQVAVQCTCNELRQQLRRQEREDRRKKRREWIGDRIDIMIGKGTVKIKYDDEVEEVGSRVRRSGRWFGW